MAIDLQNPTDQSATSLVGGILDDVQDLVKQQVQLARNEVTKEVSKAADAAVFFASGAAVLFFAALVLVLTMVHLLHWISSPAGTDPATIPLWACHAIVGGPAVIAGGVLTWLGREKLSSINPLHNPATEALKDNLEWATNSRMGNKL